LRGAGVGSGDGAAAAQQRGRDARDDHRFHLHVQDSFRARDVRQIETEIISATSFDNPDFVDVVVHSYRHRYGVVPGDPAYQELEDTVATQPPIPVPTVVIDPRRDGLVPSVPPRTAHEGHFPALLDVCVVHAGHNVPQQAPDAFADAILHAHENS
jgi:pimeloyl-ACP methyl ester carboxylesterase